MKEFDIKCVSCGFANESDLTEICEIEKSSITPPWSYKALYDFSKSATGKVFAAKLEDVVVGYITFSEVLDELQIANVATSPLCRRCGIGEKLLTYLICYAAQNNFSTITLEVRKSNLAASALYKKLGFTECGTRKNYYKSPTEDAILMNYTL